MSPDRAFEMTTMAVSDHLQVSDAAALWLSDLCDVHLASAYALAVRFTGEMSAAEQVVVETFLWAVTGLDRDLSAVDTRSELLQRVALSSRQALRRLRPDVSQL